MTPRFFLHVRALGAASLVSVNDAVVSVDLGADGVVVTDPVDTWIKPEENLLQVDLRWPEGQTFAPGRVEAEATVFIADPGSDSPRPGRVLARFEWPLPGHVEEEDQYPLRQQVAFQASPAPATRLWDEAETVTPLGQGDRAEIFRRVAELRQALMNQQPERAYDLLSYRYAEEARAEGKSEGSIRAAVLEGYRDMFSFGHLEYAPVDEQSLILRPLSDGKVVHAMRDGYQHAILALHRPSGTGFGIPVYMARVGGQWTIVR